MHLIARFRKVCNDGAARHNKLTGSKKAVAAIEVISEPRHCLKRMPQSITRAAGAQCVSIHLQNCWGVYEIKLFPVWKRITQDYPGVPGVLRD